MNIFYQKLKFFCEEKVKSSKNENCLVKQICRKKLEIKTH